MRNPLVLRGNVLVVFIDPLIMGSQRRQTNKASYKRVKMDLKFELRRQQVAANLSREFSCSRRRKELKEFGKNERMLCS